MLLRMQTTIKFDRIIDAKEHYLSPGGFTMTFGNAFIEFDFDTHFATNITGDTATFFFREPSFDEFPDMKQMLNPDLLKQLQAINEFFVYTGETNEPEIHPAKLTELLFILEENDGSNQTIISVPKNVLEKAVLTDNSTKIHHP